MSSRALGQMIVSNQLASSFLIATFPCDEVLLLSSFLCAAFWTLRERKEPNMCALQVPNNGQLQPIHSQGNLKPFVSSGSIAVSLQQTQSASGLSKLDIFFVLSFRLLI
jgi:hypothetical protein